MSYRIKEIYFTQQGEGKNTGKNFVFVRFSGCNLWSGKEKNRESAICKFCDTDFYGVDGVNGGIYEAKELVRMIKSLWMVDSNPVSAVLTGGEPLLQLDDELIQELKKEGQSGRNKITQYTRYGTVVFALIQSTALTFTLQTAGLIDSGSIFGAITAILSIVTGTVFLMWLGEQISERGIGNGISLIIATSIIVGAVSYTHLTLPTKRIV